MPREKINDPDTPGLYVQVNWRKPGDDSTGNPGYMQVSTHNERADAEITHLLDEAHAVISALTSALHSGESDTPTMKTMRGDWRGRVDTYRSELTGTYVTPDPGTSDRLIRTLHKAKRQAFGGQQDPAPANSGTTLAELLVQVEAASSNVVPPEPPEAWSPSTRHTYPAPPPTLDGEDTGSRTYASGGVIRPHADNSDSIPAFLSEGSGPYSHDPYTGRPAPTMPTHGYHLQAEADELADPESSTT